MANNTLVQMDTDWAPLLIQVLAKLHQKTTELNVVLFPITVARLLRRIISGSHQAMLVTAVCNKRYRWCSPKVIESGRTTQLRFRIMKKNLQANMLKGCVDC